MANPPCKTAGSNWNVTTERLLRETNTTTRKLGLRLGRIPCWTLEKGGVASAETPDAAFFGLGESESRAFLRSGDTVDAAFLGLGALDSRAFLRSGDKPLRSVSDVNCVVPDRGLEHLFFVEGEESFMGLEGGVLCSLTCGCEYGWFLASRMAWMSLGLVPVLQQPSASQRATRSVLGNADRYSCGVHTATEHARDKPSELVSFALPALLRICFASLRQLLCIA